MPGTVTLIQQRGNVGSIGLLVDSTETPISFTGAEPPVGILIAPTAAPCVVPVIEPKRTPASAGAPVLVSRPYN